MDDDKKAAEDLKAKALKEKEDAARLETAKKKAEADALKADVKKFAELDWVKKLPDDTARDKAIAEFSGFPPKTRTAALEGKPGDAFKSFFDATFPSASETFNVAANFATKAITPIVGPFKEPGNFFTRLLGDNGYGLVATLIGGVIGFALFDNPIWMLALAGGAAALGSLADPDGFLSGLMGKNKPSGPNGILKVLDDSGRPIAIEKGQYHFVDNDKHYIVKGNVIGAGPEGAPVFAVSELVAADKDGKVIGAPVKPDKSLSLPVKNGVVKFNDPALDMLEEEAYKAPDAKAAAESAARDAAVTPTMQATVEKGLGATSVVVKIADPSFKRTLIGRLEGGNKLILDRFQVEVGPGKTMEKALDKPYLTIDIPAEAKITMDDIKNGTKKGQLSDLILNNTDVKSYIEKSKKTALPPGEKYTFAPKQTPVNRDLAMSSENSRLA